MKEYANEQSEVHTQLEVLRFLSDSTDDYLFSWNFRLNRIYFPGPIWKRYAIMEPGETVCSLEDWYGIVYEKDLPALQEEFDRLRRGEQSSHNMEYRLMDRSGNRVWISCRGRCQMDQQGRPLRMIGRISDTVLAGEVDALTGAFTADRLQRDIRTILNTGESCFLLLLGIDNLKNINIRNGRDSGNQMLRMVADTLEKCVAPGLRIYRVNGDCFAVNLPVAEQQEVERFYQQVRSQLKEYCTISAGAVAYHFHPNEDSGSLYQYAEEALDKAKRMGKDTLSLFSQKDYEQKLSTIELQEELHQGILDGFRGFYVCYQPQVSSRSYELFGAEALLRFNSPTRGIVSPQEFVPILEQTGMICQVGLWVLETALRQCRIWRAAIPQMHISVNVSYIQLAQENVAQKVLELVENSGLPGETLTLEVTESMQLQDYSRFNKIFYQWKQAGIEISVDDFGTGYSSLSYLKRLEIDEVKIDRCFVSGIQHSAYNSRLLKNMVELAHSSRIRVCCEGVETREELATLERLRPDLLQGFLFHRPYTAEQFEACFLQKDSLAYTERVRLQKELRGLHWSPRKAPGDMGSTPETLNTILDAMEEVIYVRDLDTYELYYLNPAGRRLTGIADYQGQKCYKVLQGLQDPCSFCNEHPPKKDSFYAWEMDNKLLNGHFIMKNKLIPWRGKTAWLGIAIDVSEHEMISRRVHEKLDFAESMLACAQVLAQESDMEQATLHMLRLVGEFYQADRAYIFERSMAAHNTWSNTYEWNREGVPSQQAVLQKVPEAIFQRWLDIFDQEKAVIIPDVEKLRECAPGEWEVLHPQGCRRILASPIWQQHALTGFLGVDNPRHCIEDDSLIRMLTLFLNNRFHHNETEERLGELLNLHYQDVLKNTSLGLWFIRLDTQGNRQEMFADETMRRVLGLEKPLPPEECYRYWHERIRDGYGPYVHQSVQQMVDSGRVVELEYPWEHPTLGEVTVRCTGIRGEDADGWICLEGYHRIVSDMECPKSLPDPAGADQMTGEVFAFHPRTGSICFETPRLLLAGDQTREEHFPRCWVDGRIVHPHFAERFAELFAQIARGQMPDHSQELLLRTKTGRYQWFELRSHVVKSDGQEDTVSVSLAPIDSKRALELENLRLRDFYQASLSDTIAYAEVDLEGHQIQSAGGLWAGYEKKKLASQEKILDFMEQQIKDQVWFCEEVPLDRSSYRDWRDLLSGLPDTRRVQYQRLLDGQWIWVEFAASTFREEASGSAYALLTLKNIDSQTRRELAHWNAARRDPLTAVYNRTAFQSEVEAYMMTATGQKRGGILILVDVDNFKQVNDQFGHLEGDRTLRQVTVLLQHAFRSNDLVGRLGGDEFMVFIKGTIQRNTLESRLQTFMNALWEHHEGHVTCSIGITFVDTQEFSFEASMRQADLALYQSKQIGKNRYCYAEDIGAMPRDQDV